MKKEGRVRKNNKKRLAILIIAVILIGIIVGIILIKNAIVNQEVKEESKLAGGNTDSSLMASYIKKGITIGGITGTLEAIDTSDATATPENLDYGKTAYVNGVKITGTREENIEIGDVTGEEKENTELTDHLGNKIVIPAGFKVVNPGVNVESGIIIEDVSAGNNETKGSQFVWIPVGKIKTAWGEEEINLERYAFADDGTPSTYVGNFKEETPSEHSSSGYKNTIAKDINEFKKSVEDNGGYYIGRYEAGDALAKNSARQNGSGVNNQVVCKSGVYPYNWITQPQAANLCQKMYSSNNFTSDLINSYAWDTAIVFIQECSGDKDYSRQIRLQTTLAKCGEATDGTNKDVRCNIYDMAGNTAEFSTETNTNSTLFPSTMRGGYYDNSNSPASHRNLNSTTMPYDNVSSRVILYL